MNYGFLISILLLGFAGAVLLTKSVVGAGLYLLIAAGVVLYVKITKPDYYY